MAMKISRTTIHEKEFAFDGCHKIYLIGNEAERAQAIEYGYKILPIEQIERTFWNSCSLRFIETWTTFKTIVPQCAKQVTFKI